MSMTIGPHEVDRGEILPASRDFVTAQRVVVDDGGGVHVAETNYDEQFLKVTLKDTRTAIENVVYFIRNGVRYRAIAFYVIDGFGTSWQVRYWSGKLQPKIVAGNLWQIKLIFRVEV